MADTKYMERQYYSATLGEETYQVYVSLGGEDAVVYGDGSPEGVLSAGVGTIYRDTTNGILYIKESGTGNTGWVAELTETNLGDLGDITVDSATMTPSTEPGSPTEGQIYYDSAANKLKVYTGSAWETITSS